MGTSTSSSGGKSGSPFDPEWLAPSGTSGTGDKGEDNSSSPDDLNQEKDSKKPSESDLAPKRRYAEARTNMSGYLSGKGSSSMISAVKGAIQGMGGARRAASSMRNTARGAGDLAQFLTSARENSDPRIVDWVSRVRQANLSANDLILELVKETLPSTGSIDDESLRNAAANALGQLYEEAPDVDVFLLTDQQIHRLMAITIAGDVCNRMDLLLGQAYEKLKYSPQQVQMYRNDIQEYIQAEVGVVMDKLSGEQVSLQKLAKDVLQSALEVFSL